VKKILSWCVLDCWFPSILHVCMSMSFSSQKNSLLGVFQGSGLYLWYMYVCMYVNVLLSESLRYSLLFGLFLLIVDFHLCFIYVCQSPSPYKNNYFVGRFRFVVFMSATCMSMSSSLNHLGHHSKPLLGLFFIAGFHPCFMHVCQCPFPEKKIHFLGRLRFVVFT